jgi:hypothetical protein
MRTSLSLEEFAALVQREPGEIRDLVAAGLLDPAGEGRFDDLDLLRLMAIRHWGFLGYSPERLAEALASGEVEPFLGEYIYPRRVELTLEEAAKRTGVDPDLLRDLRTALGWARTGFLEGDLRVLQGFKAITDAGMPREAVLEGARVFGDALRRLAETEVRLVHVHIHERLLEDGLSEEEVTRQIHALQDAALPLLDSIVERVHHEHFLQASIEDAFVHLVDTERVGGRGSVEATIAFVDVEAFTKLTETEGDQAAIEVMTQLDSLVRGLALEHDGKVVKHLGDALMLAFRRPADAASFARGLHQAARAEATIPGLRVAVHCGPAIYPRRRLPRHDGESGLARYQHRHGRSDRAHGGGRAEARRRGARRSRRRKNAAWRRAAGAALSPETRGSTARPRLWENGGSAAGGPPPPRRR